MSRERDFLIAGCIFSVFLLFVAAFFSEGFPYGYYTFLRLVVCGTSLFCFYSITQWDQERPVWLWVFALVALLFNPIIPVHLTREIWEVLNVACGLIMVIFLFCVCAWSEKITESESPNED